MQHKQKSIFAVLAVGVLISIFLYGMVFAGTSTVTTVENTSLNVVQKPADITDSVSSNDKTTETVVYDSVEMRRYEGEDGHPYIHNVQTNHTAQEITGYQRGMLAFDKNGNPLKIDWYSLDTELDRAYFYLYEDSLAEIAAGNTHDVFGGWSLDIMKEDTNAANIAYVLYCNKELTFADGTLWENPDFEHWRSTYEGKKVDVVNLENYYPYAHQISFS